MNLEEAKTVFATRYPEAAYTLGLAEHPEAYNGPCMCGSCIDYMLSD